MKWSVAWLLAFCASAAAGTVEDIRSSGVVTCGLDPARPGFSVRSEDYRWTGFDVDLCKAMAAAILENAQKVNLVALNSDERIVALQSGEVDVLLHGLPWTQGVDALHGLMFVWPTLSGPAPVLAPDDANGSADVTYGPMVRQGDDQWFHVVRGVVMALMRPPGQDQSDAALDAALQLSPGWRDRAVATGGTYAELRQRHFGEGSTVPLPSAVLNPDGAIFAPP